MQRVGDSRADAGMVLVIGRSEQLDRLAVEEEAALRVEADIADAKARVDIVDKSRVGCEQFCANDVQARRLDRPQLGRRDNEAMLKCPELACGQAYEMRFSHRNDLAARPD